MSDDFPPRLLDSDASEHGVHDLMRDAEQIPEMPEGAAAAAVQAMLARAAVPPPGNTAPPAPGSSAAGGMSTSTAMAIGGAVVVAAVVAWFAIGRDEAPMADVAASEVPAVAETDAPDVSDHGEETSATENAPPAPASAASAPSAVPSQAPPRASARSISPTASAGAASIDAELKRLREARKRMVDGDPEAALKELETYDKEFKGGAMAPEAEAMAIEALAAAGKHDAARARAQRFLARHGRSPQAARIRALLQGMEP